MKIEHIAMYVRNLERTKDFFIRYFGASSNDGYHNPETNFRSYFLTFEAGARLEVMTKPELEDNGDRKKRFGYAHIAFSVGSKEAVDELTLRMKADDFPVFSGPRTTGDGYYESCIIDLEGNLIEITP